MSTSDQRWHQPTLNCLNAFFVSSFENVIIPDFFCGQKLSVPRPVYFEHHPLFAELGMSIEMQNDAEHLNILNVLIGRLQRRSFKQTHHRDPIKEAIYIYIHAWKYYYAWFSLFSIILRIFINHKQWEKKKHILFAIQMFSLESA